jgi:hypothetical protein
MTIRFWLGIAALSVGAASLNAEQTAFRLSAEQLDGVTAGSAVAAFVVVEAAAEGMPIALTSTETFAMTTLSPSASGNDAQDTTLAVISGSSMAYGGVGGSTSVAVGGAMSSPSSDTFGRTLTVYADGVMADSAHVFGYEVGRPAHFTSATASSPLPF